MSNKKKEFFLVRWFKRCFLHERPELSGEEEEKIQTPMRAMVSNFVHRPLAMIGLIVFLLIFLLVMIGPKFYTLDLSYQDNTQLNVPPGMNMMSIPDGMKHKVADISPGTTYGVGVDTDGNVYTWGYTKITETIDLKNIPEEVQNAKIVNVAAGYDHIVALDENGAIVSMTADEFILMGDYFNAYELEEDSYKAGFVGVTGDSFTGDEALISGATISTNAVKTGTADVFAAFAEIQQILGFPIDHSFLNYKKELLAYGYRVGKTSMKKQTVNFLLF